MNVKRFVLACLAVFVFVFLFSWVFHGVLLKNTYAQTASMWRTESEMSQHFGWLVFGQLIQAIAFCLIYTRSESHKRSVAFGAGYGIAVGILKGGGSLIIHAVQPLPMSLIGAWIVGDIIQVAIAGAILGAIYPGDAVHAPVGATVPT
jgi:hypothetical protein